jgi:hypothetical protein
MKNKMKLFVISIFVLLIASVSCIQASGITNKIDTNYRGNISNYISIFYLVVVLIIYLVIFFKYDKENISTKHIYSRDISEELDVEIAEYIYSSKVTSKTIWSTFLNLVHKGIYTIEKGNNSVGIQTYNIKYIENEIKLPNYENEFVKWLNGLMDEDKNINLLTLNQKIKRCKSTCFLDNFSYLIKTAKESLFEPIIHVSRSVTKLLIAFYVVILLSIIFLAPETEIGIFATFFAAFTSGIYSIFFVVLTKSVKSAAPLLFIIVHYSAFQMGIFMMFMQNNLLIMFFVYLLSYWLIFYSLIANKKTKAEVEFIGKLKALKKYLNDFSYISNKELDSSIVWGRYYAFAIALDVNKKNKNYLSDGIDSDIFDLYTNY